MSYNLFLDDERNPNRFLKDLKTWEVVRTYDDFCKTIMERGLPGFISCNRICSIPCRTIPSPSQAGGMA